MFEFLNGFEFWKIEKSSNGRIGITICYYDALTVTKSVRSYVTKYCRKNESVCELTKRIAEYIQIGSKK